MSSYSHSPVDIPPRGLRREDPAQAAASAQSWPQEPPRADNKGLTLNSRAKVKPLPAGFLKPPLQIPWFQHREAGGPPPGKHRQDQCREDPESELLQHPVRGTEARGSDRTLHLPPGVCAGHRTTEGWPCACAWLHQAMQGTAPSSPWPVGTCHPSWGPSRTDVSGARCLAQDTTWQAPTKPGPVLATISPVGPGQQKGDSQHGRATSPWSPSAHGRVQVPPSHPGESGRLVDHDQSPRDAARPAGPGQLARLWC